MFFIESEWVSEVCAHTHTNMNAIADIDRIITF